MRKLTFFSLVGITSIAFAHAGWAAGHEGVFGSSGGFGGGDPPGGGGGGRGGGGVVAGDTRQAGVGADRAARWVAAEAEWAPADLSPVVAPLTTIAEACITGTR